MSVTEFRIKWVGYDWTKKPVLGRRSHLYTSDHKDITKEVGKEYADFAASISKHLDLHAIISLAASYKIHTIGINKLGLVKDIVRMLKREENLSTVFAEMTIDPDIVIDDRPEWMQLADAFIDEHPEFMIVPVTGDGNCLYNVLLFLRANPNHILLPSVPNVPITLSQLCLWIKSSCRLFVLYTDLLLTGLKESGKMENGATNMP
jgi:hypothetical protein